MNNEYFIDAWLSIVIAELHRAAEKFGDFNSAHEDYAVIREELDELWDAIKNKKTTREQLTKEAVQVTAMGLRFLLDVCGEKGKDAKNHITETVT